MKKYLVLFMLVLLVPFTFFACKKNVEVTSIQVTLSGSSEMNINDTRSIDVSFLPANANFDYTISSTDPSVVAVLKDKKTIVALKKGEAIISVTVKNSDIRKYISITVIDSARKLDTPSNLRDGDNNDIIWDNVPNSSYYIVELNGEVLDKKYYTNSFSDFEKGKQNIIKVKAVGNQTDYIDSDFSSAYSFTHLSLIEDLKLEGNKLTWSSETSTFYKILINGVSLNKNITDNFYILDENDLSYGNNTIKVIGFSNMDDLSINTGYSNSVSIKRIKKVENILLNNNKITWDSVENCKYTIKIVKDNNETLIENILTNFYVLNEDIFQEGVYNYSIQAVYQGDDNYINSGFQDKNSDNRALTFTKLNSPLNIHLENNSLIFDEVLTSSGYVISINGEETTITSNKYLLDLDGGLYSIKVKVLGVGKYLSSSFSEPFSIKVLNAPTLTFDNTNKQYNFNEIENVTKYRILVTEPNGQINTYIDTKNNLLNVIKFNSDGNYNISVQALSTGLDNTISSKLSNELIIIKLSKVQNVVMLNNNGVYSISFNEVHNANKYNLVVFDSNNQEILNRIVTSGGYNFSNEEILNILSGNYTYMIKAMYEGDRYIIDGDFQTKNNDKILSFCKLETPKNIKADKDSITWDISENASSYKISVNDKESLSVVNKYLRNIVGSFTFKVKSVNTNNDDNFYIESNYSQEITFNKLPKVNIALKNGKIEWDLITGANSYDVSINNKKIDFNIESGKGYVNISSLDKANKYTVTICAIADNENNYLNSSYSDIVSINRLVAKNLKATIVDNYLNITWNKEESSNGYILNINDGEDIQISDKNISSYKIPLNENSYNKVSIKYIGSDEYNTLDSDVLTINITVNKCETINSEDILIENDYLVFPAVTNAGGYIIYAEQLNGSTYSYFNEFQTTTNKLYLFDKLTEGIYRFKIKAVGNKTNSFDGEYSEYSGKVEKLKAPIDILIETIDNEDYSDYYKLSYVTSLSNPKFNIIINDIIKQSNIEGKDTLLKKSIFSGSNEYRIQLQVKGDNSLNTITSDYSYTYTVKMFNSLSSPEIFNSGTIYINALSSYVNVKPTFTIHIFKLEDNSYSLVKSVKLGSGDLLNNRYFYNLSTLGAGSYKAYFTANIDLDKKLYYVNDPIAVSEEITFTILKTPELSYRINPETGKAEIIWEEVPNASSYFYELTVGGEVKDNGNINDLYYIPKLASLTENLEFNLTVKAIGSGNNINSNVSEVYTGIKLAKVKDVTLNSSNNPYILSWSDVNTNLYYDIYINGEKFATTEDYTYSYTFTESLFNETGSYTIQLISKPNNNNCFESSPSDYYVVTKNDNLEKAYIDEDKLYFVGGGTKFKITINGTEIVNIEDNSNVKVFDISSYKVGDVFSIQDLGNGTNILPSSSSIEITYNPLPAVSNIRIENNKIVWDSVANSTGYIIIIKNANNIPLEQKEVSNSTLSYVFDENRPAGNYIFEIKALGNLVYSNSVYSKFNFIKSNIIENLQFVADESDNINQSKVNLKWDYDGEFNGFLIEVKNNVTEEVFFFTVTTNSFSYDIDINSLDSYSFRVKVIGKYESSYLDSNYSKSNLIAQRIDSVQNITSDKNIIKWDKITNAEHYQVIIINITTSETLYNDIITLNNIDVSNLPINNNDEIQITIKPIGNGKIYLSGNTNSRNFTKLDVPTIKYIENGIEINSEDISNYHIFLIKPDGTKEEITSSIKDKRYVIPQNYAFGQYSFEAYVDGQDGTLSSNVTTYSLILEKLQGVKNLRIENVKNASDDDYKTYLKWEYEDNDIKSKGNLLCIIIKYVDGSSKTLTFALDKKEALLDGNVNLGKFDIEVYVSPKNNYVYSSNEVLTGYNKLNVNDIKIEIKDGVVTWNYINDILKYVITINDEVIFIENTNSLKLDDTTLKAVTGTNNIKIKAIGDLSRNLISSDTSKSYTFEKLSTPEIIINNGNIEIKDISTDEIIKLNHIFEITEYVDGNYVIIDSLDYQNTLKFLSENYQKTYYLRLKLLGKNSKINSDYSNYLKVQALKAPKDLENNLPTVVKNERSDSDWLLKWNVVENAKGYIIIFSTDNYEYSVTIENNMVSTIAIPTEIPAGSYKVTITAYTTSEFSSYLINSDPVVYYFDKVEEPTLYLKNGVLYWNVVNGASYYNLFVNDAIAYSGPSLNFDFKEYIVSSKEYTNYCKYEVKLQAVSSESHGYVSSVITPVYYILKPVEPGELTVKEGSLIWNLTGYNTYNSDCDILIKLYDKDKNLLATEQVPRSYFIDGFPRKDLKLSNLFKLSEGGKYYVRIAEVGSTVDKLNYDLDNVYFVTSDLNDYKEIYINNAPKLSIFDNNIYIKDNKIIINVEIPNKFNEVVKYLIYVNDEFVYEITSSEAVSNLLTIDLENLNLSTGVDRNRDVKRISICMQGNTYVNEELTLLYVTGLFSDEQSITVLEKVYGLSTEDGKLKWNKVEGCNGYEIVVVNVEKGVTYTYTVGADENKFDHTTLIDNLLLPGENIIKVRALGNGETTTNGAFSTETRFIKLTNDVKLQVIDGKLAFEYDDNFNYVLKIDDEPYLISKDDIEILEKNGIKYALVETKIQDTDSHNYSVQVLGNTSQDLNKLYLTSDYSNTINATMLTSIISIKINENGYITWKQEITKNNGFRVYINNIFYSELFTLQDYLTSIPVLKENGKEIILSGQIVIRVQAIGNSGTNGELYLNSRISLASLDATILDPVKAFTLEEGKLTWTKVDNAYGYVINVYPQNGGSNFQIEVGNENGYYDISKDSRFLPGSSYKFGIYAKGDATNKTFNSFETKKNYKVENEIIYQDDLLAYKLNTPNNITYISSSVDPYIYWTLIENADSYEITLFNNTTNETRIFTSSTNQFMLKDAGLVSGNQYSITIRALSNNKDDLSFIYSNSSSAYIIQNPSTVSNFIYDDSNYKFTWDKDSNTTVKYKIYYTIYNLVNGKFVKVADHIKDVGYNNFFILEELGYYGNVYVRSYALDGLYSDNSDILFEQENYLLFNLFEGGSGTFNDPYLINSYTDLKNMEKMPNKYYLLNKDLDLTDITIDLFNDKNNPFNGNFDGNNKTITLKLIPIQNKDITSVGGLFGYNQKEINNLNIIIADSQEDLKFNLSQLNKILNLGLIVGTQLEGGTISNCNISGSDIIISESNCGQINIGGIVGESEKGSVVNCTNNVNIKIQLSNVVTNMGGIVGQNTESIISNCTNNGDLSGLVVGGIAGNSDKSSSILKCTNNGSITISVINSKQNQYYAGGIVGKTYGKIENCINYGKVSEELDSVYVRLGGIAGYNYGDNIYNCVAIGSLSRKGRNAKVGSIAGESTDSKQSYNNYCYSISFSAVGTGSGSIKVETFTEFSEIIDKLNNYNSGNEIFVIVNNKLMINQDI